jgi:hypothetical protein
MNKLALTKIITHSLSHYHNDVVGLLLENANDDDDRRQNTSSSSSSESEFLDYCPMFHTETINISSMNEIALAQIDSFAKQRKMRIAGVFASEANGENLNVPDRVLGLFEALKEMRGQRKMRLLMFDLRRMKPWMDENNDDNDVTSATLNGPFRVFEYVQESGDLKELVGSTVKCERVNVFLNSSSANNIHEDSRHVFDFDDHFDDIANDWRNLHIKL